MVRSIHAFAEKVTLIVNGGKGIGRAVALQLALQGAFVVVGYSAESDENKKITDELKSLGTLAHAIEFERADALIDQLDQIYGRLDLLVICLNNENSFVAESIIEEAVRLTESRPKVAIVVCGAEPNLADTTKKLAQRLPTKFRVNCVILQGAPPRQKEFELFAVSADDDAARVITFLLSPEAKALNGQVLYID